MKVKGMILSAIMMLMCWSGAWAEDVITLKSEQKLNKEQKKTKKYAEDLIKTQNNKVLLPKEFNHLLGDSVSDVAIELETNWNEAFFVVEDSKKANLIIPLIGNDTEMQSMLNVVRDNAGNYHRTVITHAQMTCDSIVEEIIMTSNIYGMLINAYVLQNNEIVTQFKGTLINDGITEIKSTAKGQKKAYNRFVSHNKNYDSRYSESYEYLHEYLHFNSEPYIYKNKEKVPVSRGYSENPYK